MTSDPVDWQVATARDRARQRAARYNRLLREVALEAGGRLAGDDGTDVADSVKELWSLDLKAGSGARRGLPAGEALLDVRDLNRYTILFDEHRYTAGVERARELIAEQGLTWERGANSWEDPTYKGYNTWFRDQSQPHAALDPEQAGPTAERHPLEVQFHTQESFAAKSENHALYELAKSGELEPTEYDATNELQARRTERVVEPPGHERLDERVPPRRRPERVPEKALETVRQRAADLRAARGEQGGDLSRAPPEPEVADATVPGRMDRAGRPGTRSTAPPAAELRRLAPERSSAGRRAEADDEAMDRGGLERT